MSGRYSSGQTMPRPGVYFREEATGATELIGARNGVVAVAFKANWGPLGEIVTLESPAEIAGIYGDDSADNSNVEILRKIFIGGASQIKAVRVGSGGTKASTALKDTTETTVISQVAEREFTYMEEMSLSASRKGIREILDSRTAISPSESRIIGGKLVLKGIIQAEILYQDLSGELGTLRQEYLFSQILETSAAEDSGFARANFQLAGYEYTLGSENDREDDHIVTLSLHIRTCIEILEKRALHFLADLYSISDELSIEPQTLSLLEDLRSYSRKQNMREVLETAVAVKQVMDASVSCGISTAQKGESGAWVQTPVRIKVLYLDENDALLMAEKEIQVKGETDISDGSEPTIQVCCPGEVAAGPAPEGIEVRFTLEFSIDTGIRSQRACVAQAAVEEGSREEGRQPSIVLRKVANGTRLWDIAKQYRTTGADILAANQLESENAIPADRLLLIPRRKV